MFLEGKKIEKAIRNNFFILKFFLTKHFFVNI